MEDSDAAALQQGGIFKLVTPTIKVAIVDAIPGENHKQQRLEQLKAITRIRSSGLKITLTRALDLLRITEKDPARQRAQLRQAIKDAMTITPTLF